MRASNTQLDQFARAGKIGFAAVAVAATAVTTAVTLLSKKAITLAVNFDESMRKVNTLALMGQKAFEEMKDRVLALSVTLGKGAKEMGDALYQVISAGYEGVESMHVLKTAVKMATAGMAGQLETADALTTVLNAWELSARGATKTADTFFLAIKYGKTTMAELAPGIGLVATQAAQTGASFEEVAAALAALTKLGVPTRYAITALRSVFMSILKPVDEAREFAEEAGVQYDIMGVKAHGLAGFLDQVAEATKGGADELAKMFPNIRAILAALPLTTNAAEHFNFVLDEMRTKTGAMDEAFREMNRAYSRQIEYFKTKWTKALIDFGETIWPIVAKSMEELTSPEMIQTAQLALLDLAEVIMKAFSSLPLIIANVRMNLESLHHITLKAQKLWLLIKTAVTDPWRTDLLAKYGDALFEVNKQLDESESKIDGLAEEYADLYLKLQKLIPPFDELREKIKAGTGAVEELNEEMGPYITNMDAVDFIGKNVVARYAQIIDATHKIGFGIKKVTTEMRAMGEVGQAVGEGLGIMFGNAVDKADELWKAILRLIASLMKMYAVEKLGTSLLGTFVGGAISAIPLLFMQKGGLVPAFDLPLMSSGIATSPVRVAGEAGSKGEVVAPAERLPELLHIEFISSDPAAAVRYWVEMPDGLKDEFNRGVIVKSQERQALR